MDGMTGTDGGCPRDGRGWQGMTGRGRRADSSRQVMEGCVIKCHWRWQVMAGGGTGGGK